MEEDKELVNSIKTLNDENDVLRKKVEEFETAKALSEKEAEIKKRVDEELKKIKEEEQEEEPEEEPESKGVVDEPKEEAPAVVKENFIMKNGDLTMAPHYWKEFDSEVKSLDFLKEVRWLPNAIADEVKV